MLDEVAFYNRVLTADEVRALAQNPLSSPARPRK